MEDLIDAAVERLIANADGDVRRAMRALLIEALRLQLALERVVDAPLQADQPPWKLVN